MAVVKYSVALIKAICCIEGISSLIEYDNQAYVLPNEPSTLSMYFCTHPIILSVLVF